MFLYALTHSFQNQCILSHPGGPRSVGDCISDGGGSYFCVLGDTIHRPHLYQINQAPSQLTYLTNLLSSTTIELIHQLSYTYYTTYHAIFNLYLPQQPHTLLQKQPKKQQKQAQDLIIMPDWRTIIHQQQTYGFTLKEVLGSQHTLHQDITWFWNIKYGLSQRIICTPGECFWDYHNLKSITVIDPHKRYYKSQQDPRYDIMHVCELMSIQYGAELQSNI